MNQALFDAMDADAQARLTKFKDSERTEAWEAAAQSFCFHAYAGMDFRSAAGREFSRNVGKSRTDFLRMAQENAEMAKSAGLQSVWLRASVACIAADAGIALATADRDDSRSVGRLTSLGRMGRLLDELDTVSQLDLDRPRWVPQGFISLSLALPQAWADDIQTGRSTPHEWEHIIARWVALSREILGWERALGRGPDERPSSVFPEVIAAWRQSEAAIGNLGGVVPVSQRLSPLLDSDAVEAGRRPAAAPGSAAPRAAVRPGWIGPVVVVVGLIALLLVGARVAVVAGVWHVSSGGGGEAVADAAPPVAVPAVPPPSAPASVAGPPATLTAGTTRIVAIGGAPLACSGEAHGVGTASSVLTEGRLTHGGDLVVDGLPEAAGDNPNSRLNTAWCEGVQGDGEGQWVEVETCCPAGGNGIVLRVAPGYQKTDLIWRTNNRVAEAAVEVRSGASSWKGDVRFTDSMVEQYVKLPEVTCSGARVTAKLTVTKVFPGSKYQDTCISDVGIFASTASGLVSAGSQHPFGLSFDCNADSLGTFTKAELRVNRNEVYARHGHVFTSADLRTHFAAEPWYHPDPSFKDADLPADEQACVDRLKVLEDRK